jgi:hypothetical protein
MPTVLILSFKFVAQSSWPVFKSKAINRVPVPFHPSPK